MSARGRLLRGLLLATAAVAAVGVAVALLVAADAGRRPPIVLVSIDTLRADHLGCYGYPRATSPHVDAFRRDAILFGTAIAQASSTLPSHASLFTSLIPQHHGASHTHSRPLPPAALTLAEVLRREGYTTAAVVSSGQLVRSLGLAQGFDTYLEVPEEAPFADTVREGLRLLGAAHRPIFLFLHTYQVHQPYTPSAHHLAAFEPRYERRPPPVFTRDEIWALNSDRRDRQAAALPDIVDAYDGDVRAADEAFGVLIGELRRRGLYHRTLVALTSDHGEELGEHGWVGWHSHTLYEELLLVPWLLKLPGAVGAGATVRTPVQGIDLAPTLLAAVGLSPPPEFAGRNALLLVGPTGAQAVPAVLARERMPHETAVTWGLREGRWKLAGAQLYDLAGDPGERRDVALLQPQVVRRLRRQLLATVAAKPMLRADPAALDAEALRSLRALGYGN